MEEIKMVDLLGQYLNIKPQIDKAIEDVLRSTAFIQAPTVAESTRASEHYLQVNSVISYANSEDALQVAMMSLELRSGDGIIHYAARHKIWHSQTLCLIVSLMGKQQHRANVVVSDLQVRSYGKF